MSNKATYIQSTLLHQCLPIFFQPWWLDIASKDWDMILAIENKQVLAVLPICREKKMGFHLLRNPLLTPYLGPFFFQDADNESFLFQELWKQMPKYDSFDIETTTGFQYVGLFEEQGFDTKQKDTYILDLAVQTEMLYANINSNHRNLIKQATTSHTIEEKPEHISTLLTLHKITFERKDKSYPFDAAVIEKLITESIQKGQGCLLSAKDQAHHITASIFVVWDRETMYLLLSAFDINEAHQGAVRMLIWEAIKKAKALNIAYFDFEGSMDPGIAAFFRRFGGERKTYLCASKTDSPLWKLKKKLLG